MEPTTSIKAIVQRHVTEEETVSFEGTYSTPADANAAVETQLALVRSHMARYNEEVLLIDQRKREELTQTITEKGEELKKLETQLSEARAQLFKVEKHRGRATG